MAGPSQLPYRSPPHDDESAQELRRASYIISWKSVLVIALAVAAFLWIISL